jgi:CDP-diacylglycerol--serine O-phosphatidyltransferase
LCFLFFPVFFVFCFWIGAIENRGVFWLLVVSDVLGQLFRQSPRVNPSASLVGKIKTVVKISTLIYLSLVHRYFPIVNFFHIGWLGDYFVFLCALLAFISMVMKIPKEVFTLNLANMVSFCNLICGVLASFFAWHENYFTAFQFFIGAQLLDAFDGVIARKFGSTKYGKHIDSACDLISFCVFPTIYFMSLHRKDWILGFIIFIFFLAGTYRLYRYTFRDKNNENIPEGNFLGLPTPAGAMMIIAITNSNNPFVITSSIIIISYLMAYSKVQFRHFSYIMKSLLSTRTWKTYLLLMLCLIVLLLAISNAQMFVFIISFLSILYFISGIIIGYIYQKQIKRRK